VSFPAYPDYKDSGVAWLGEVPGHWELTRVGARFCERREKVSDTDFPPLSVTKNGIVPQLDTAAKTDDNDNRKCVLAGDFVINSRSDRKGSSGLSDLDGSVSLINTVIRPDEGLDGGFVHHMFRSVAFQEEYYRYGKGIVADLWSTNYGEMKAICLAVPPLAEQTAIAAFLDRETAKIDALVTEQERLIALLKEKRQAVISHAVTKGLNPNAIMKNSGIPWLGEIPAHWDATALKRLCNKITDGAHISPETEGGTRAFVSTKDVSEDGINFEGCLLTSESSYEYLVRTGCQPVEGDVLFSKDGTIGRTVVVREARDFVVASSLIIIRPCPSELDADFLDYLCQSSVVTAQVESFVKGAGLPRLSIQNLLRVIGVFPPISEQRLIAEWLSELLGEFKLLMGEAQFAITLLQERRAALISAAVTGKIDVRGVILQSNVVSVESARRSSLPPLRAVVGAYSIRELGPMGRMAVMKAGYLAEAHAGFEDLKGTYERYAAGPYDQSLIAAMERGAGEICAIVTSEPQDERKSVTYVVPKGYQPPSDALSALVGEDRAERFLALLSLLKGIGRDGVEAAATLYAVWNDLLAAGKAADDDAICNGVLNDWHPEKAKKFKRADLDHWLDWMRRNDLVPDGSAPRTDNQGKLFA